MSKVYGLLSYLCGSAAIALLAVALMAGGGQMAKADPGQGGDGDYGSLCDFNCAAAYPLCTTGSCAPPAQPSCATLGYTCKLITYTGNLPSVCQCNAYP